MTTAHAFRHTCFDAATGREFQSGISGDQLDHGHADLASMRKRLSHTCDFNDGDCFVDLSSLWIGVVRTVEIVPAA